MTDMSLTAARRQIGQIGYWKLIRAAEARLQHPDGDRSEMGRLQQALGISGLDDGVEVLEWYRQNRPAQLAALTESLRDALPWPERDWTPLAIKLLRVSLGLQQVDLARLMAVTPAAVGHWETGCHRPTGPAMRLLDCLYHTSPTDV